MRSRKQLRKVALERIEQLFEQARKAAKENPALMERYVQLIKQLRKKYHPFVPRKIKMFICKHCNAILIPGVTARVRLRTNRFPHLAITCLRCGTVKRMPYKLKKCSKST
ncbi:MAG: ribonuclease P [bacterium]|nr:ribonuclease P [bacterium]